MNRRQAHFNGNGSCAQGERELPQFLRDLLACPPRSDDPAKLPGGVHRWMFKVARQLLAHRTPEESFTLLQAVLDDCGRALPARELREAILAAERCKWQPRNIQNGWQAERKAAWPAVDLAYRAQIVEHADYALYDLWEASPVRFSEENEAEIIVPQLFPGDPLVCVGYRKNDATTAPLHEFQGKLGELQFVVPSPMSKLLGKTQEGKDSPRCLDNVATRRFIVAEFDSGTLDEQAALLRHLSNYAPLTLVVHSGGKSLHGWFWCHGYDEETIVRRFFSYAVRLGADPQGWVRCQFHRMPGGLRDNRVRQEVFYFNPEAK